MTSVLLTARLAERFREMLFFGVKTTGNVRDIVETSRPTLLGETPQLKPAVYKIKWRGWKTSKLDGIRNILRYSLRHGMTVNFDHDSLHIAQSTHVYTQHNKDDTFGLAHI